MKSKLISFLDFLDFFVVFLVILPPLLSLPTLTSTPLSRHMRTHSRYSMGDAAALVEAAQREAALKLEPMEV